MSLEKIWGGNDYIYLIDYTPYSRGREQTEYDKHIMNIKNCDIFSGEDDWKNEKREKSINYFKQELDSIFHELYNSYPQSEIFVLCLVPSSKEGNINTNMIKLAKYLIDKYNFINGLTVLKRIITVPSAHLRHNKRTPEIHLNTIEITDLNVIKDKNILLLDDVMTSGSSFKACSSLLKENGAKKVFCLALAKTKED